MESVWLIETGDYSDYHVVGIFSTKAKALMVANAVGLDESDVREWMLNPAVDELRKGYFKFTVIMLRDGTAENVSKQDEIGTYGLKASGYIWDRPHAPAYKGQNLSKALSADVWAKDEEHAVKVANEMRAQMIASGEWDKG